MTIRHYTPSVHRGLLYAAEMLKQDQRVLAERREADPSASIGCDPADLEHARQWIEYQRERRGADTGRLAEIAAMLPPAPVIALPADPPTIKEF